MNGWIGPSAHTAPRTTLWTIDVEALDRAVTVPVHADRSPSLQELLDVLEPDERTLVQSAHTRRTEQWRRTPIPEPPEHVHVGTCVMNCCPGCGDGCGHCEGFIVCVEPELGCVMPAGHDGPCVPAAQPRWSTREYIERRAEPLRIAGIDYTIEQNRRRADRYKLVCQLDPEVPGSGCYRRRLTAHNRAELIAWLAAGHTDAEPGPSGELRLHTGHGTVPVRPGDIVCRNPHVEVLPQAEHRRPAPPSGTP